jgi:hypothetical protein
MRYEEAGLLLPFLSQEILQKMLWIGRSISSEYLSTSPDRLLSELTILRSPAVEENTTTAGQDPPKSELPRIQFAPEPQRDGGRGQHPDNSKRPAGRIPKELNMFLD